MDASVTMDTSDRTANTSLVLPPLTFSVVRVLHKVVNALDVVHAITPRVSVNAMLVTRDKLVKYNPPALKEKELPFPP